MISIFFLLIMVMISLKTLATNFAQQHKIGFALLIAIPAIFLYPMILVWIVNFLFSYELEYWTAFLLIMTLRVFTFDGEVKQI